MEETKVIFVGVDGASWEVIRPLMELGELRGFGMLASEGAWGVLKSTMPPVSAPAWVSMFTGKNPGKHGIFDFVYPTPHGLRLHKSTDVKTSTLFEYLALLGRRCVVIGLPLSYPPKGLFNGIMFSDFLYPRISVFPSSKSHYLKRSGYKPVADTTKRGISLIGEALETLRRRLDLAKTLLLEEEWDFFFVWIGETDTLSHPFWKEMVEGSKVGRKACQTYRYVDAFLRWILRKFGDDSAIFVASDHGFQYVPYEVRLNALFKALGLLEVRKGAEKAISERSFECALTRRLRSRVAAKLVFEGISLVRSMLGQAIPSIDYENSVFVPTMEALGVYVRKSTAREIALLLRKMTYKGRRVFRTVKLREEVYSGPYVEQAPHVLFLPDGFLVSPSLRGSLFAKSKLQGYHDENGVLIAYGEGIKRGEITSACIYDVLPTLLHMFDLPLPNDLDGRILPIFEKGSVYDKKATYVDTRAYKEVIQIKKLAKKLTDERK